MTTAGQREGNLPEALGDPEVHVVEALDGWRLEVLDYEPAPQTLRGASGRAGAIVIAGHAMMVDRRTLVRHDRDCLVNHLVRNGHRVLVPDLRGHGDSGPRASAGADWSYDSLVDDVGVYVELAQSLSPDRPVVLVGHSLFAHASLAWVGREPEAEVRGVVALAADLWNRRFEPDPGFWVLKRLLFEFSALVVAVFGRFPAIWLGVGSNDEAPGYWWQFRGFVARNRWVSRTGFDYWKALRTIECRVLHVVSEGDRLYARPRSATRFTAPLRHRDLVVLGRDDSPGELSRLRPDHMGMVTDPRSHVLWSYVAGWIARASAAG